LGVIPGNSQREPESRCKGGFETRPYQSAFAGMTVGRTLIYFANFSSRILGGRYENLRYLS
jgi:hypothetical protein